MCYSCVRWVQMVTLGLGISFVASCSPVTTPGAGVCEPGVWYTIEGHEWIGELWGAGTAVDFVNFDQKDCLKCQVLSANEGWALVRTKRFPAENWISDVSAVRVDVFVDGLLGTYGLKLEVREAHDFEEIAAKTSSVVTRGGWNTVTWELEPSVDLLSVGSLSIVFENLMGSLPTFYLDNIRLVTKSGEEVIWDNLDGAMNWFYFGNWYDWSGIQKGVGFPGIDPISSADGCPVSPGACLYLQWDYEQGEGAGNPTAELGTNNSGSWLNLDLSDVDRVSAWVKSSSAEVSYRVFFFHCDSICHAGSVQGTGFATASSYVQEVDTWQKIVWSIPWPTDFDRADIDEIKLVADGIDEVQTGIVRFDEIEFLEASTYPDISGRVTVVADYDSHCAQVTSLGGVYGELNDSEDSDHVTLATDWNAGYEGSRAALRVDFHDFCGADQQGDQECDGFTGVWNSLLGRSDFKEFVLDISNWDHLRFRVRSSGESDERYNLKVELKESLPGDEAYYYSAYRYIGIDGSTDEWQTVLLDLDLNNNLAWCYNRFVPDGSRIKELVFVFEDCFNPSSGTIYLDDVELIATGLPESPITDESTDQEVLAYFLKTNFNYFLYATHPDSGLILDRLSYSNLATVAGTGFGLTAWCLAADIDIISRDDAYDRIKKALTTLATSEMGWTNEAGQPAPKSQGQIGVNGYFYHFLDAQSGTRIVQTDANGMFVSGCELSSVDTALCIFGVITCRQAVTESHGYSDEQETVIRELADTIIERVDWPFLLQIDAEPNRVYLAWKPESSDGFEVPHPSGLGYVAGVLDDDEKERIYTWDYTTDEILLIAMAGMSAPEESRRLPLSVMSSWLRQEGEFEGYSLLQSFPGAAFTYQFANLWLPLRELGSDVGGTDWWLNGQNALRANYAFCTHPAVMNSFDSFDGISFGLTACEDPTTRYMAFGSPPAGECDGLSGQEAIDCFLEDISNTPNSVNGTIAPYGAVASIEYMPEESIAALRHYYFDLSLWNELFGFPDSFHLNIQQLRDAEKEVNDSAYVDSRMSECLEMFEGVWQNPVQFSIDQGPIVLALGNYLHDGIIRSWVASNPDIRRAIGEAFNMSVE